MIYPTTEPMLAPLRGACEAVLAGHQLVAECKAGNAPPEVVATASELEWNAVELLRIALRQLDTSVELVKQSAARTAGLN